MHAVTHSIMFHHFHDERHPTGQGSISADEFDAMLDWLEVRYNLVCADSYFHKALEGKLAANDVCLSFDDALLCQYDVALPVLAARNLTAFFFIYSSPMEGAADMLEIYRYFRTTNFEDIDEFYSAFFDLARNEDVARYNAQKEIFKNLNYLGAFPFYTDNDRWFRYLRDKVLHKAAYEEKMSTLMRAYSFDKTSVIDKLWMNDSQILNLQKSGHIIGLHSYNHPTGMHELPREAQKLEYEKNRAHLSRVLGGTNTLRSMSHPCGNYNEQTLDVLKDLGIKLGFRSNMAVKDIRSLLEIPREDHANVYKEMYK